MNVKQQENIEKMNAVYERRKLVKDFPISLEDYQLMKAKKMTDQQIMDKYRLPANQWYDWKRAVGLVGKKEKVAKPHRAVVEEKAEVVAVPPVQPEPERVSTIKDRILQTIDNQIDAQTDKGVGKYTHNLDDCPPEKFNWQQMINEELIDALQYQQKEIGRLQNNAGLTLDQYQHLSARTAVSDNLAMLNYGLGISGEAGEVSDLIKKCFFHGHDDGNLELAKELGDVLWYISQIAREANLSLSEIAEGNIEKLQKRYPEGFSEHASVNRSE